MRKLLTRTLLPVLATAGLALATATPAQALVILTSGHVDVIDVDWNGSDLVVSVLDDTGSSPVERVPSTVQFNVPTGAKTTVPSGSKWAFLGSPGATVWILPQSSTTGLLYAGWNTDEVSTGVFVNNTVTFTLKTVSGPGNFSVYTTSLGNPTVLYNSGNGLPDSQPVLANKHAHANWAFTASGTYTVTFEVTGNKVGGGSETSGDVAFTFTVQP